MDKVKMKYQQIQNDCEIILESLKRLSKEKKGLARKAHCYWLPSDWKKADLISDLEERIGVRFQES
jgi:hypothetical protein